MRENTVCVSGTRRKLGYLGIIAECQNSGLVAGLRKEISGPENRQIVSLCGWGNITRGFSEAGTLSVVV